MGFGGSLGSVVKNAGNVVKTASNNAFQDNIWQNPREALESILGGGGGGEGDPLSTANYDLSEFINKLGQYNNQFFNTDFGQNRFSGLANIFENIGTGGNDPRFDAYQQAQFNIFDSGATQQRQNVMAELGRRGLGNSSTGLNQLMNVDSNLAQQKQLLGSQLGMQQLGRQDNALGQALSAWNQYSNAQDMGLNSITAGLQNLLAVPSLEVSRTSANNQGRLPPPQRRGLLGDIFSGIF